MTPYPISPRLAAPTSVSAMMMDVIVALIPTLATAVYLFGPSVLVTTLGSMGFCVLFQRLYHRIFAKNRGFSDPSPWVTGLLLALSYPPDLPFWAIPLGSFFAIIIVKELFGGFACNFVNPALGGRVFLASSPFLLSQFTAPRPLVEANLVDAISSATPMAYLQQGVIPPLSPGEMFIGFHSGSIGEVSTLMLLLGGCYLLLRQVIRPTIPLTYLATVAVLTYSFPLNGQDPYYWMVSHLFSGGLMLGAFFFATDPVTSPVTPRGTIFFGIGCGILTVLLRYYGSYPDGVAFAILTMNGLVWWLDKLGMPRPFGMKPFTRGKQVLASCQRAMASIHVSMPKKKELSQEEEPLPEAVTDGRSSLRKCLLSYGLVFVLVVGSIYGTHSFTSFSIHRVNEEYNQSLLQTAMPKASYMSETPYHSGNFEMIYLAYDDQGEIGYCVEVITSAFVGEIHLLVGVDLNGAITGIAVLEEQETLHMGQAVLSEGLSEFIGKSGTISLDGENRIDGISGATVTLQAVIHSVNTALEVVQQIPEGGLDSLHDTLEWEN